MAGQRQASADRQLLQRVWFGFYFTIYGLENARERWRRATLIWTMRRLLKTPWRVLRYTRHQSVMLGVVGEWPLDPDFFVGWFLHTQGHLYIALGTRHCIASCRSRRQRTVRKEYKEGEGLQVSALCLLSSLSLLCLSFSYSFFLSFLFTFSNFLSQFLSFCIPHTRCGLTCAFQ